MPPTFAAPLPAPAAPPRLPDRALTAAAPLVDVIRRIDERLLSIRELAPSSDAQAALAVVRGWLVDALDSGRCAEIWVDTAEAADLLGLSRSAVVARINAGALPATKWAGAWRIERRALEAP